MSRSWIQGVGLSLLVAVAAWAGPSATDETVLIVQYLRFALAGQVGQQMAHLAEGQDEGRRAELRQASDAWQASRKESIRSALHQHFGAQGRERFEAFVNEWMRAEGTRDADVLHRYAVAFRFDPPEPASFADLRNRVLQEHLDGDLQDAAALLARVQSWIESPAGGALVVPMAEAGRQAGRARPVVRNPLREAEGGTTDWQATGEEEAGSPLDAFGQARQERRDRVLEEAQAGMQQVAEERRAAEEEYAQKKMAEAQADAEAVKRQADRLAATEQEALEQRQKSWGNRLKSIVGATLSAATGAFTGGIGTRAGQEAASALFD